MSGTSKKRWAPPPRDDDELDKTLLCPDCGGENLENEGGGDWMCRDCHGLHTRDELIEEASA